MGFEPSRIGCLWQFMAFLWIPPFSLDPLLFQICETHGNMYPISSATSRGRQASPSWAIHHPRAKGPALTTWLRWDDLKKNAGRWWHFANLNITIKSPLKHKKSQGNQEIIEAGSNLLVYWTLTWSPRLPGRKWSMAVRSALAWRVWTGCSTPHPLPS